MEIRIEKAQSLKPKPQDEKGLQFGKQFTDHMFLIDYAAGKGWYDPRIVPYGPLSLDPAATCLHYGQLIFEGLKAYRTAEGKIVMFRPDENMRRMNESCERMCIPQIDEDFMVKAIAKLVEVEQDWVPHAEGTSLYIRPYILSSEAFLGVHPAKEFLFPIIVCPVGSYYKNGLAPIKIYVETDYVRAVRGGTGFAKCAGNYAASLRSQVEAEKLGYDQVLWLDGVERRNIEEVGAMNVFFVLDGEVVTPALNGSILSGITRKSCIQLLKDWGVPVSERTLSIDEVVKAHEAGKLQEAFGAGTAAVISPIGQLLHNGREMVVGGGKIGEISQRLYDTLTGIQTGKLPDPHGWMYTIVE